MAIIGKIAYRQIQKAESDLINPKELTLRKQPFLSIFSVWMLIGKNR